LEILFDPSAGYFGGASEVDDFAKRAKKIESPSPIVAHDKNIGVVFADV
jgi:hypothetical protein